MKLLKFLPVLFSVIFYHTMSAQWTNTNGVFSRMIKCFTVIDSTVIAGTEQGLVRSTNNGTTWANAGGGMSYQNVGAALSVASYPFDVVTGTNSGGTFSSSNSGTNFVSFPDISVQIGGIAQVNSILKFGSKFYVGTDRGVYLLPQFYPLSTWIQLDVGLPSVETKVRSIAAKDGEVYAGTDNGVNHLNGTTWEEKNSGLTSLNVMALASTNGYLIAGTGSNPVGGVYISSDNGSTWTLSLSDPSITSLLAIGPNILAGSNGNGVWLSTNYGSSWAQVNTGFGGAAYNVLSLGVTAQYLFVGTNNANIWRRPYGQLISIPLPVELSEFTCAAKGRDVQLQWKTATEVNNAGFEIERALKKEHLGNDNWSTVGFVQGSGTTNAPHAYSFSDKDLSAGKYAYRLKQIDRDGKFDYSAVIETSVDLAAVDFELLQNYPNPFNPTTTIEFAVPTDGLATVKIFNAIGQEVATVVNEEMKAGEIHRVVFNGQNLSSGLYFARLQSGGNAQLKKMTLVK